MCNKRAARKAIPQNQFQNGFEGWTRRWHRCIASQWEYFEGDHGGIQKLGMWHFYRDEFANFIVRPRMIFEYTIELWNTVLHLTRYSATVTWLP